MFQNNWNKKAFLVPECQSSMAAVHAKVYAGERQEYQLRISDCNNAIKLWGKIETQQEFIDFKTKLQSLKDMIQELENEVTKQLSNTILIYQ